MAEPKCPKCPAEGVDNIKCASNRTTSKDAAWVEVVFCNQCGYVYNVLARNISELKID